MKKCMIAIGAAALCGAVSYADVTSANVVGYQGKGLEKFTITSGSFTKVDGGEEILFSDYAVNCNEEDESATGWVMLDDVFNTYTSVGLFDKSYAYLPKWFADVLSEDFGRPVEKGWYDVTDSDFINNCSGNVIPFGHGIVAKTTGSGAKITFSGAVKNSPTVTDVGKFLIAGNSAPADIKIGQLVVNCNEEDESSEGWVMLDDVINTFTSVGLFDKSYVYLPQWFADVLSEDLGRPVTKGWYDSNDGDFIENLSETKIFTAGEGFVAKATGTGATITVKSALATEDK